MARAQAPEGTYPSEFFFGALELRRWGHTVDLIEVQDSEAPGIGERLAQQCLPKRWLPPKTHVGLLAAVRRILPATRGCDVLVATNSALAFALTSWTAGGPVPIVGIQCGLLNYRIAPEQRALGRRLLRRMYSQLFADSEVRGMQQVYGVPEERLEVNPFGVDLAFWQRDPPAEQGYLLAVGNDAQRDYPALLQAVSGLQRCLVVTRHALPQPLPDNVTHIQGALHASSLDDLALRRLYSGAAAVLIPLRPGVQPSGQSVALQAMACGTPVIMTRTDGFFDPARLRDTENLLLVPPGDPVALRAATQRLLAEPALRQRLSTRGLAYVRGHGDITFFAKALERLCLRVCRQ
jgi:glycosyltransferase involved in cell wall biosynthesis